MPEPRVATKLGRVICFPTGFCHSWREDFLDCSLPWRKALLERPAQHRLEFLPIALPAGGSDRHVITPEGSLAAAAEKAGPSLTLVRRRRSDGEVEAVDFARSEPDSHGYAEPELPGAPLAERLKQ